MSNVIDLSHLVQSTEFSVFDVTWRIPPMNDSKMQKVMALSKEMNSIHKGKEDMTEEEEAKVLEIQNSILSHTVQKKTGNEFSFADINEYTEWPMPLKSKVIELIFKQISGPDVEVKAQEKNLPTAAENLQQ